MEINLPKFEGISLNIPLNYNFNSRILVFTSSNLTNLRISRDTFIYSSYIDGHGIEDEKINTIIFR